MTKDIIEAIDGALDDWTVSGDAMRWTPEPPEPAPAQRPAGVVVVLTDVADPTAPTVDEISRGIPLGAFFAVRRHCGSTVADPGRGRALGDDGA